MSSRPRPTNLMLPAMFHWSPRQHRVAILRRGLLPKTPSGPVDLSDPEGEVRQSVCMSPSPQVAWDYSVGVFGAPASVWDLWQIVLSPDDEVHFRPEFGPAIIEVRVANRIPKSRLWHVGERTA